MAKEKTVDPVAPIEFEQVTTLEPISKEEVESSVNALQDAIRNSNITLKSHLIESLENSKRYIHAA